MQTSKVHGVPRRASISSSFYSSEEGFLALPIVVVVPIKLMAAMGDGYRRTDAAFFACMPTIESMPLSGNRNNA